MNFNRLGWKEEKQENIIKSEGRTGGTREKRGGRMGKGEKVRWETNGGKGEKVRWETNGGKGERLSKAWVYGGST